MRTLKIIIPALILLLSCEKTGTVEKFDNMDVTSRFALDNPIIISNRDCAGDAASHTYLCMDSVLTDSRCPTGAYCFWEGEALVRLKFASSGSQPLFFVLKPSQNTVINGFRFTLKSLIPYPTTKHHPLQSEYKAEMLIEKI